MAEVRKTAIIKKFLGKWTGVDPTGWHVLVKNEAGEWESFSGPHYTRLMAASAAESLGLQVSSSF